MAAVMTLYPSFFEAMGKGQINLQTADLRLALMGNTFPDDDGAALWSAVSSHETTGANYSAGGLALTGKTVSVSGRQARIQADNVVFPGLVATFRYGLLYDSGTGRLIGRISFGEADTEISGVDFIVNWQSAGVFVWGDPV